MPAVRLIYAFILAPALTPALWSLGALLLGSPVWANLGLFALVFFAYLPALVLGAPAYLLLRRRGVRLTPLRAMIAGALVAAVPWFVAAAGLALNSTGLALLWLAAIAAVAGAVSGLAFWAVAAWGPACRRQV
ncbi:hypothetical protein LJR164_000804 [Phenylobacterium sp. LjRoot164]|uniref:hypothetical protein n=1 Tax=unclassified Phenylobacterium TaxID=2640670 RepID=UPI003ECDA209